MGRFLQDLRSNPQDPRYVALARGLQDFGATMGTGAGTQGFGALAPAVAHGTQSAGYTYREEQERQRKEEIERRERQRRQEMRQREDVRWDHYLEGVETAKTKAERKRREKEAKAAAEAERRESMLDEIRQVAGDQAAKRASLLKPANLERQYLDLTGAEEPKPPSIRELDGDWYIYDPEHPDADDVGYRLYKKEPEDEGDAGPKLTPGQVRNEAQEIAKRKVGTWKQFQEEQMQALKSRFPGQESEDTGPFDEQVSSRQIRSQYNVRFQKAFDEAMKQLGGGGSEKLPRAGAGEGGRRPTPDQVTEESGLPEQAKPLVETIGEVVPQEVAQSPRFQRMLQAELQKIHQGTKTVDQVVQELREAFGGGR